MENRVIGDGDEASSVSVCCERLSCVSGNEFGTEMRNFFHLMRDFVEHMQARGAGEAQKPKKMHSTNDMKCFRFTHKKNKKKTGKGKKKSQKVAPDGDWRG
jgi:hypothetical protein